jgi:DNA-binding CsgD family transcriptional regulator
MIDKVQLTAKQIEALELQQQGFTYQQMADRLGITPEAVSYRLTNARRRIAIANGETVYNRIQLTQKEAEVLDLQQQGFTRKQIAEKIGIAEKSVDSRLVRAKRCIRIKEQQSSINKCAKEYCDHLLYTENAITLDSYIGRIAVYLCTEHLADFLQANIASQK